MAAITAAVESEVSKENFRRHVNNRKSVGPTHLRDAFPQDEDILAVVKKLVAGGCDDNATGGVYLSVLLA